MITGKTSCGYEYSIEKYKFDDMELVDMLGDLEENPFLMGKVIEKLIGKEEKKKLYDLLRTEDGNVPVEATRKAIEEIFNSDKTSKNC